MVSKKLRVIAGVQMLAFAVVVSSLNATGGCEPEERTCDGCNEDYLGFYEDKEGFWHHWWWFGYHGLVCDFFGTWQWETSFGEVTNNFGDFHKICNLAEWDCEQWSTE